jgi:hypothetical protein
MPHESAAGADLPCSEPGRTPTPPCALGSQDDRPPIHVYQIDSPLHRGDARFHSKGEPAMNRILQSAAPTLAALLLTGPVAGIAQALDFGPVGGAIGETRPIVDLRLRTEQVDQEPLARDATATTLRGRLGFETGKAWSTSLLVEGEFVVPLTTDYNSTTNGNTTYPVVVDPETYELNRLQLTNTSLPDTTITLGRQRMNLDDQRFVGSVGWRQNEQTLDAVRVVNRSVPKLILDLSYVNRVNRVFGHDSPQGVYKGESVLANASYQLPLGKLTAFGYWLDIEPLAGAAAAVRDSSFTTGLRFAGEKPLSKLKIGYALSYATQRDHGRNPLNYSVDYWLAEATATYRGFSAGVGYESLGGNGAKGFTTPLATLHKFQGWADKFLTTPVNGIDDLYVSAGYLMKGVGPLDTLAVNGSYHDYQAARLGAWYGRETNVQMQAKWRRYTGTFKLARYESGGFATDTTKYWLQVDYVW